MMRLTKLGLIIASGIGLFTLTNQRVNAKTALDTNSDYYMPAVFPSHHLTYNMQNMNQKDQYVHKEFLMMQESRKKLKSLINKFDSLSLPTLDSGYVAQLQREYHEISLDIKKFNEYKNNASYETHQLIEINRLYPIRIKNEEKVWDQLNKQ